MLGRQCFLLVVIVVMLPAQREFKSTARNFEPTNVVRNRPADGNSLEQIQLGMPEHEVQVILRESKALIYESHFSSGSLEIKQVTIFQKGITIIFSNDKNRVPRVVEIQRQVNR